MPPLIALSLSLLHRYNSRSSMTASAALHRPSSASPAGGDGDESPRQRVKGVDFEVDLTADARHELVEEMRARGVSGVAWCYIGPCRWHGGAPSLR